ncbi:hypothetical protein ABIB62_000246 [Mucilaginibacter sp. UYP25]
MFDRVNDLSGCRDPRLAGFGKTSFDLDDCLNKALFNLSRLQ